MKKAIFSGTRLILCNLLLFVMLVSLPACAVGAGTSDAAAESQTGVHVDVTFDYKRMPTHASNQLAIWVEDQDGEMVKTILVTGFTASRRGYRNREMTLSGWVNSADPEALSDEQIDAVSSATPTAGGLTYSWDLTDQNGNQVPDGVYTVYLEGTLYWESSVLFKAVIDTADIQTGNLPVETVRSEPDNTENEDMIENVQVFVKREEQ